MWAKNCLIYHLRVVEFMKTLSAIYAASLRYLSQYKGEEGVTFPNLREGVLSINSQIVLAKSFLSKRFLGIPTFFEVK